MKSSAHAAALHGLAAFAKSLGLSRGAFEAILLEVAAETTASATGTPERQFSEIRRRTVKKAVRQAKAP